MGYRDYGGLYPTAHQETVGHQSATATSAKILAKDIMRTNVHCTLPDTPVFELVEQLEKLKISGMPVVDAEGKIVGIISEKDTFKLILQGKFTQALAGTVSDYMSTEVETLAPEDDIFKIADLFYTKSYRRLPVIKHGKVVGIISRRDVLGAIKSMGS